MLVSSRLCRNCSRPGFCMVLRDVLCVLGTLWKWIFNAKIKQLYARVNAAFISLLPYKGWVAISPGGAIIIIILLTWLIKNQLQWDGFELPFMCSVASVILVSSMCLQGGGVGFESSFPWKWELLKVMFLWSLLLLDSLQKCCTWGAATFLAFRVVFCIRARMGCEVYLCSERSLPMWKKPALDQVWLTCTGKFAYAMPTVVTVRVK